METHTFKGFSSVAFSTDSQWLVTGTHQGFIVNGKREYLARLWEVSTGKEVRSFLGHHTASITSLAISGDGKWLVTASHDKTARLWDMSTGNQVRVFTANTAPIPPGSEGFPIGFSPTERDSTLQWMNKTVDILRRERDKELESVKDNKLLVKEVAHKHEQISANWCREILWRDVTWEFTVKQIDLDGTVANIRVLPFTTMGHRNDFFFGKPPQSKPIKAKEDLPLITDDGANQILVSDLDFAKTVRAGSAITIHGKINDIRKLTGISISATKLDLLAKGAGSAVLASTTLKEMNSLPITTVGPVALSTDAKWLVTGNAFKTARLWEVSTGKEIRSFQGHTAGITSVALSGDGKWLVTGSIDNTGSIMGRFYR